MTAPAPFQAAPDAIGPAILLELGKMSTQIAVMDEKLNKLPDHENRLRILETSRNRLYGGAAAFSLLFSAMGTWIGIALSRR